jgi:hypothetical protein
VTEAISEFTMELFARQAVALLENLDLAEEVVAATSLGADVALELRFPPNHLSDTTADFLDKAWSR